MMTVASILNNLPIIGMIVGAIFLYFKGRRDVSKGHEYARAREIVDAVVEKRRTTLTPADAERVWARHTRPSGNVHSLPATRLNSRGADVAEAG